MLLGPKFYIHLERLTVWRHSLFALVLATRQYPQFALWTEINDKQGKAQYLHALKQCWEYHYDKFNHIDLTAAWEQLEPFLPLELEEYSEGDSFAFDTAVMINAALDCIPLNSKEGKEASNASMASAIRLCELRHPEQAQDEESLLELPEIEAELDYQVELLELVSKPRSGENIKALLELALRDHCSGIGLENPLTVEDFASCFTAHYESRTPEDDNYDPRELVAQPESTSVTRGNADTDADAEESTTAIPDTEATMEKIAAYMQRLQDAGVDDDNAVVEAAATAVINEARAASMHKGLRVDGASAANGADSTDHESASPTATEQAQRAKAKATPSAADIYGQGPKSHKHHKDKHHGHGHGHGKAQDKAKAKDSAHQEQHKEHGHHHHHHDDAKKGHGHKAHQHQHQHKDKSNQHKDKSKAKS